MSSSRRPVRFLMLLIATVLAVPLTALLGVSPAHAASGIADGAVYDGLGDPVSGVTVEALASPAYTTVSSSTTTDGSGAYALPIANGTYHLRYSKSGYDTAFYGGGTGVAVVVSGGQIEVDGEPVEDNLLEDVQLDSTALHAVTGSVTNAASAALSGITVDIFRSGEDEVPVDTATTTGSGAYALDVPTGVYQLRFTDPSGTYLSTWYGGDDRTEVTVTAAQAIPTVVLTTPPPATEFPIAGTVADANGDPVPGVTVTVDHVGGSTDSGTGSTTAEGDYSVSVLPGTYQVTYAKTGFTTTKYGGADTPSTITVAANGTLSVAPAEDLVANRLGDVTLASTPFAKTGAVKASGTGVSGITVRAFPEGSTDPSEVVDTATSGAGGSYTVDLPIGSYDLAFTDADGTAPTYNSATLPSVRVAQDGSLTVGGSPVAGLPDVALTLSSADTPHPVTGSVVDVTGAEIDGLTVTAVPQGSGEQASDDTGADGGLGDHGRYRLSLKPGSYQIQVEGGASWVDATYLGDGTSTALVTVQLNGTVLVNGVEAVGGELGSTEVKGSTTYALSGKVQEGANTAGLSGITVKAYAEGDTTTAVATTTSGAGGTWSLTGAQGLVVGTYTIEFSGTSGGNTYDKTSYGGATPTPVTITQGGVATVDGSALVPANTLPAVGLTRSSADTAHPVTGTVTDANGDALAGVTVTPSGGPSTATATTDTEGAYTLQLKPGTYSLAFAKSGFTGASYPSTVTVALDGSVTAGSTPVTEGLEPVELAQTTGTTSISGTVLSGGSAVSGITVEVFPEGDTSAAALKSATTNGSGAWTITGLKIGTYSVRFTDNVAALPTYVQTYYGGSTLGTSTPVKVGQADAVTVNDVPQAGGALGDTSMSQADDTTTYPVVGDVTDANGDPVVGATVTPSGGPTTATATTDAEGHYALALRAGTYHLTYTKAGFTTSTYPGSGEATADVVVTAGGSGLELDAVTLDQTTGTGAISGRTTSGGSNVAGITVEVFFEGDLSAEGLARPAVQTAANGTWSVTGLKIGTYTVQFTDKDGTAPTYVQATLGPVKVAQGNQVYLGDALTSGGALGDTVLTQADSNTLFPVTGDVVDANFDPLAGATVTAEPQGGSPAATPVTTNEDGAYTLQVKAGTYKIKFTRTGFTAAYYLNAEDAQALVVVGLDGVVKILGEVVPGGVLDSVTLASTTKYPLGGSVVSTGAAPISGITVRALVSGETTIAASATTAANGTFTLQLPVGTYDITYVDTVAAAPTYITTFYGGATPRPVKVSNTGAITDATTDEPLASLGSVTMTAATASTRYPVTGVVYDQDYEPLNGATVLALPAGTTDESKAVDSEITAPDTEDGQPLGEAGVYRLSVTAGKYWLKYKAPGKATTFLLNEDGTGPVIVTVSASGISAPGYDFVGSQVDDVQLLLPAPTLVTAPKLSGKVVVGGKITTTIGTWNPNVEASPDWKDYVYIEWFIDGKAADDYSSGYYYQNYKVPAEAAGKKLSYRITIEDPNGLRAAIVWTSKPIAVPKAVPKLTASYKKGKLTLVVKVAGISKPLGTFVVKDGKQKYTVTLTAKSKGKAVIKLKKPKPGKHTLKITYSGDAQVAPAKAKVKIKV